MSNLIKWNYINVNEHNVKVIESSWQPATRTVLADADTVPYGSDEDEFRSGLEVKDITLVQEEEETISKESLEAMLVVAENEAESIIANAKEEALRMKTAAMEEGKQAGYEEGLIMAQAEIDQKQEELEQKMLAAQSMVEKEIAALEPQFVSIMTDLIQNISGVLLHEHEEVILFLLQRGIRNLNKCEEITIRVSYDDYDYCLAHQDVLVEAAGEKVSLMIECDEALSKNQCMIDTKEKLFNCSLDEQMDSLIRDLKLLARC